MKSKLMILLSARFAPPDHASFIPFSLSQCAHTRLSPEVISAGILSRSIAPKYLHLTRTAIGISSGVLFAMLTSSKLINYFRNHEIDTVTNLIILFMKLPRKC